MAFANQYSALVQGISHGKIDGVANDMSVTVENRSDLKGVLLTGHQIDVISIIEEVRCQNYGTEIAVREVKGQMASPEQ